MKYSNDWLLARIEQGHTPGYIYFWGHREPKNNLIQSTCMSQWYPRGFYHDDTYYPTAEHWMMVHKALTFDDEETARLIMESASPSVAKSYGRKVKNFDDRRWEKVKYEVVLRGNVLKFGQSKALKRYLIETSDAILVEASPYDPHWGIGMTEAEAENVSPREWRGTNLLGYAIMEARDQLLAP